ncbi:hypothetical protein CLU95_4565 [Variovorax sp. 54]|uniref:hypothetical protein n=1 Tax=Variovorax sp. 54 TaxID=2035212 RepID=UPI000C19FF0A|nr:hypothetical protein [Variovorax sp. 54]PIF77391.1 hypothetical protein CLU95_4565 [Variovorax sp. 54]
MANARVLSTPFRHATMEGLRRWIGRHAVALVLATAWVGLAGLLATELARADRNARFFHLMETQVCHTPALPALPSAQASSTAELRKARP